LLFPPVASRIEFKLESKLESRIEFKPESKLESRIEFKLLSSPKFVSKLWDVSSILRLGPGQLFSLPLVVGTVTAEEEGIPLEDLGKCQRRRLRVLPKGAMVDLMELVDSLSVNKRMPRMASMG